MAPPRDRLSGGGHQSHAYLLCRRGTQGRRSYVFANAECYNYENDAQRRTFEEIFQKRYFSSYIVKETNVFDRSISDYAQGIDALLESERIKDELFTIEHDLWHY